jgi:tRNA pseudouridine38-40 synthase
MPLIRLTIEYDGTDFVGWQFQTNGRSVQEEVEKAIKQILQVDVRIAGGGRTDAGVHARGQVASFFVERDVETNTLAKSLNAVMPHSIIVLEATEAPLDFNARYDAKIRRYTYTISQEPTAIQRNYCWQVFHKLDLTLMQKCAQQIIGNHGFRSFCKVESDIHNHRCSVLTSQWIRKDKLLIYDISANRFLHGMVRTLVGTMVNVGRGHTKYEEFYKILESNDRSFAGMSAPAKGLFLEQITYS